MVCILSVALDSPPADGGKAQGRLLPPFVTAQEIGGMLQWVASQKRLFMEALKQSDDAACAGAGDCYAAIVNLLSRPAGVTRLEALVAEADPRHRRGLRSALLRQFRATVQAWPADSSLAEVIRELLDAGHVEFAAWAAFESLGRFAGLDFAETAADVVELVGSEPALQDALGGFWLVWSGGGAEKPTRSAEVEAQEEWAGIVEATARALETEQPFSPRLVEALRSALATFERLQAEAGTREAQTPRARHGGHRPAGVSGGDAGRLAAGAFLGAGPCRGIERPRSHLRVAVGAE